MIKMVNYNLLKRYFIILSIGFMVFSCTDNQKSKNYLIQSEQAVDSIYSNSFNSHIELDKEPDPIFLYGSIEDYFVFVGVLKSRDKEGYKTMFNQLLGNDQIVDLECLYKYYPETQLLTMASNVAVNLYSFEKASKTYKRFLSEKSSMIKAYENLQKITDGVDINFEQQVFESYIDSIESSDFEDKFIYRIPLLAFSHILISEGR